MPISNDYSGMSEEILLNEQVIMNIIGNHFCEDDLKNDKGQKKVEEIPKGLLFTDFCYSDNNLIVLFGKVVIFIDL